MKSTMHFVINSDFIVNFISTEFLLGDRILAAPVVKQGKTVRNIYLPEGKWYDPNLNRMYFGHKWLIDYPAAIDVLPYFIRQDEY